MSEPTAILLGMASQHVDQGWAQRHLAAWGSPRGTEVALKHLIVGWARYAEAHQQRFGSSIADDGVLGPAWERIGSDLLLLLNGDLGRFDGGTLDGAIRDIARSAGTNLDE